MTIVSNCTRCSSLFAALRAAQLPHDNPMIALVDHAEHRSHEGAKQTGRRVIHGAPSLSYRASPVNCSTAATDCDGARESGRNTFQPSRHELS